MHSLPSITVQRPNESPLPDEVLRAAPDALGGAEELSRTLARWASEATVDEAVRRRIHRRWQRVRAEEEASLEGTLVELAERGRPVVLDVGDHRVRGTVVGLGADFVALRSEVGQHVLVRTDAVEVVRTGPGDDTVVGHRAAPLLDVTFLGVLGPLAAERPEVLVRTRSGTAVRGQLRSAGRDVLHLDVRGDTTTPTWIPSAAALLVAVDP